MDKIYYQLITPEEIKKEGFADSISLPTALGEIVILPHHAPLITLLKTGEVKIKEGKEELYFAIGGGFAEVQEKSKLLILAESAEIAEEIDEARAAEAKKVAEKLLAEAKESFEIEEAQIWLERNLFRLKVAKRKRRGSKNIKEF
jgi:F-type H+-transporting ATPase subunit epsilon